MQLYKRFLIYHLISYTLIYQFNWSITWRHLVLHSLVVDPKLPSSVGLNTVSDFTLFSAMHTQMKMISVTLYCKHRCGKAKDQENGSMGRMMASFSNLNRLCFGKFGLSPVLVRRAKYCAGLSPLYTICTP